MNAVAPKSRKEVFQTYKVLDSKSYTLGGYPQKVLFEGLRADAPILLFLHGGPGSPMPFCAGCRGLFPEITERFILVYWDQLGCGINDRVIDDSFSIEDFVGMTLDLIRALRRDFPENPIHLFAVSWGSILAAEAAVRVPELLSRVLVYGQVTRELFFNPEVFDALAAAPLPPKARQQLAALKASPQRHSGDLKPMAGLLRKHTEGYQAKNGGKLPMGRMIGGILTSPDYRFRDFKALVHNGTMKNKSLYDALLSLDLCETLSRIPIPYLMLQGSTDIVTSTRFLQEFMEKTDNPNLHLSIVPDSGHIPGGKGMTYILDKGLAFLEEKQK